MKNAPMRFAGLSLHHNPSKLVITDSAGIMSLSLPRAETDSRYVSSKPRAIRGEGELYGADCAEQYEALYGLYAKGERGVLSLPHLPPIYAYLSALSVTAEPEDDVLRYSFTFTQTGSEAVPGTPDPYLTAAAGDSLWDIAYEHRMDIETLVALNPHIPHIGELSAGEKVRLC